MSQQPLAPWQATLSRGDVVAFRFPHEKEGPDAEKTRPALVLGTVELGDELFVELAYGTRQRRSRRSGCVVTVSDRDELIAASLDAVTNFDAERRITVSVRNPGFIVNGRVGTAVLGRLTGQSLAQLRRVIDRLGGSSDRRPRPHFRRRSDPRTVRVEYRSRGRTVGREMRHV